MRFFSTLIASALGTFVALGLLFFIGFLFILALVASADEEQPVHSGSVLILDLSGPIPEQVSGDEFAQAFSGEAPYDLRDVKQALQKAAVDDRIEGAWLKMGGVLAPFATLEEIRTDLLAFKESGKPLYASSSDYFMDETDYFLASAADSVFAVPEAFFEFNGFSLDIAFFDRALEKLDIEPQIVRAGTFKSAVEPFFREDLSPENEEQLAAILDVQNRVFMDAVAEARGQSAAEWQRIAEDSAIITADDAHDAGLVDALYFEDQIVDLFRARLGYADDDDVPATYLEDYVNVSPSEAGLDTGREGEIAIVYAVGTITGGESGTGNVGADTFNEAIAEARDDEDVQAVVLRINSPGGSAAAADAMWREISLTAEAKPVIVSMGDYAASGGYWIATPAQTLVAESTTLTGSIGVFSVFFDASGFLGDKLGVTFDGVQTSPYADMFSGVSSLSDQERALMQRTTDATYQRFLEKVALSRGMNVASVDSVGQGRVWTGMQALDIGLVDQIGGLDDAIRLAAQEVGLQEGTYRVKSLPRPKTFFEELDDLFNAQAVQAWQRITTSPTKRELLRYASLLQDLADAQGTVQARLPVEITIR